MAHTPLRMVIVLCACVLPLAGCSQPKLSPTPTVYRDGGPDPFALTHPANQDNTIEVLYVTDRAPKETSSGDASYREARGIDLRVGVATVQAGGADASWDDLADSSRSGNRPNARISRVEEIGFLDSTLPPDRASSAADATAEFAQLINERLAQSEWKDVVVYVPGFNTGFQAPIYLAAAMSHYLSEQGAVIAYSWPSQSTPLWYGQQKVDQGLSIRNLRQLLIFLSEETDAEEIHIISYSAGAPMVSSAMLQLRLMHAGDTVEQIRAERKIGNVVYAGADEDLDLFRQYFLDQFDDVASRITVYTSRTDTGLVLSRTLTTGSARLGRSTSDLTDDDLQALANATDSAFVDVTDATRAAGRGDLFAHSYWYNNPWVSSDVIMLLRYDLPPAERGLERDDGDAIWDFPNDYPERVRDAATDR